MDDKIRSLLCERCLPIFEAALELERAQLATKQARDKLDALRGDPHAELEQRTGRAKNRFDAYDEKIDAMLAAKRKLGVDDGGPKYKPTRKAGRGGARGANVTALTIPAELLLPVLQGAVSPGTLSKNLNVTAKAIRRRVEALLGAGKHSERWTVGGGFARNGKPTAHKFEAMTVETLRAKLARAGWPEQKTEQRGVSVTTPSARMVDPVRGPGRPPTPIPEHLLAAMLRGETTAHRVAIRCKKSWGVVKRRFDEYAAEQGKGRASNGQVAIATSAPPADDAEPTISPADLNLVLQDKRSIAQLAHKYDTTEGEVRRQLGAHKATLTAAVLGAQSPPPMTGTDPVAPLARVLRDID